MSAQFAEQCKLLYLQLASEERIYAAKNIDAPLATNASKTSSSASFLMAPKANTAMGSIPSSSTLFPVAKSSRAGPLRRWHIAQSELVTKPVLYHLIIKYPIQGYGFYHYE